MNPSLDNDVRDKLGSYLLGEISLEDFREWFIPVLCVVDDSHNHAAINMVYEIELRLVEFSNDYWSENELKNLLRPIVENYYIEIDGPNLVLGSNAQLVEWSMMLPSLDGLYEEAS